MKKVRWGIIGPGNIAKQFANDIEYTNNSELTAVASNSLERANSFANEFNVPVFYGSHKELYSDPNIDIVYVATTHNFHYQNCFDAMSAGKAVMCEKPLTDNPSDTEQLVNLSNNNNVYLSEALWTYFLPAIQKAKEWVTEDRIGKLINIDVSFGFRKEFNAESRLYNPDLSGGVLLDMGIYPLALTLLFNDEEVINTRIIGRKAPTGVDDDIGIQLEYKSMSASLYTTFRGQPANVAYITGEKGHIMIPDFWRAKECNLFLNNGHNEHYQDNRMGLGFEFEIEAAAKDYLNGQTQSSIMPHSNSIRLQNWMQNILKKV